jgi:hypothetical protein
MKAIIEASIGVAMLVAEILPISSTFPPQLNELCLNRKLHCNQTCVALAVKYSWSSDQNADCDSKCNLVESICLKQTLRGD